eukprot:9017456-Pyramimonas_sp.AAC.1
MGGQLRKSPITRAATTGQCPYTFVTLPAYLPAGMGSDDLLQLVSVRDKRPQPLRHLLRRAPVLPILGPTVISVAASSFTSDFWTLPDGRLNSALHPSRPPLDPL